MKLIALLLVLAMATGTAGCGKTEKPEDQKPSENIQAPVENLGGEEDNNEIVEDETEDTQAPEGDKDPADDKKPAEDKKPETNTNETNKPAEKPADKPAETPAEKPAEKPVETPAEKPEDKPAQAPSTAQTVGSQLAAEFNANANSGSPLQIAEAIANGGSLPFMAGAMEVEPGLLAGFDNYEVTGFKSGAVFQPMIGSIAFVGYVFELEDGVSASDFAANLKQNANMRWNICVEAEETVTSVAGNKVFFVMCPKQFEE